MTTYTAITNAQIDAESYFDTTLAAQYRDNVLAIQEGDASASGVRLQAGAYEASSITQSDLAADSVGQSEVKTTYQAITANPGGTNEITTTGGVYIIGHTIQGPDTGGVSLTRQNTTDTASYLARWRMTNNDTTDIKGSRLYYINSSPPYNLGDGDIPLFIEVEFDPNGNIISMSSSTEAPWHYNGPTDITPYRYTKEGKSYRRIKDLSTIPETLRAAMADGNRTALDEYCSAFLSASWIEQELTQEIKNADMDLVPLALNNQASRPNNTTVLLDPVSPLTLELLEMRQHNQFDELEFIHKWCDIDNIPLPRNGPSGVPIVGFSKRNTRR